MSRVYCQRLQNRVEDEKLKCSRHKNRNREREEETGF